MAQTIKIKATDGTPVEYVDSVIGQGGMKDVYFSPDKSYVVAFFRDLKPRTAEYQAAKERLEIIVGRYRDNIFNREGGDYWKDLYCWPEKVVEHDGRIGITAPVYPAHFFFKYGSKNDDTLLGIRGKEKEGKWFASASNRNRFLDDREKGHLLRYLQICLRIARAVHRMHAAGLAHSDLSYRNVLIDPTSGNAAIIDIDGLVVPGKFPPEVVGTPDFIAPEVLSTQHLPRTDSNRALPSRYTDQHALAVLIYMYLLYRHPLRGKKSHDLNDSQRDELLSMGEKALFIEHPTDDSNRPNLRDVKPAALPWADVTKMPYTILGPYLEQLFNRAFIDGLHNPSNRPSADDWVQALVKTTDLVQPCQNPQCEQKWFIFSNKAKPVCPYCNTPYKGDLPILDFYSSMQAGRFTSDNHRLMVYNGQNIYPWHANKNIFPNEKLTPDQKRPVADFQLVNGKWHLINRQLTTMADKTDNKPIPPNSMVELTNGKQILLSSEPGGRLFIVTLLSN